MRIEGRGGPSPESWGTLDKAGVLSGRLWWALPKSLSESFIPLFTATPESEDWLLPFPFITLTIVQWFSGAGQPGFKS